MKAGDIFDGEFDVILIGRKNGKTRKFTADRGVDLVLEYEPKYRNLSFLDDPLICFHPRHEDDMVTIKFSILANENSGKFSAVKDRGDV